ncbi:hypothetical protein H5A34_08390 [Pectobacterium brasiliense]|uniref:hypothetical protein n=1 Tax=Pectobacterium brasiliense TaxID=180957 RepID=UPI001968F1FC|nr:hypothetical protein [Pectobacterium brasiliense]MBN3066820.1 hypothetical protein [Pectobacterium brasiliense]MBN3246182.1 hypothetical protein [Pectobacterium brasiliense]
MPLLFKIDSDDSRGLAPRMHQHRWRIMNRIYPSFFKLHVRWLRSVTRITYQCKLIGIPSLAAFLQLELFRL